MSLLKLTPEEDRRLVEAVTLLRASPAFSHVELHIRRLLDATKDSLVTNQSAQVPNLQGRAQQLIDLLELLHRKAK